MDSVGGDPVAIVQTMVKLSEWARRAGLLALDTEDLGLDDELLRLGVRLAVDAAPVDVIRRVFDGRIASLAGAHQHRLRCMRLIMAGVLDLQAGTSPWFVQEVLAAFLPPEARTWPLDQASPAGDQESLVWIAHRIVELTEKARTQGLLSLEDEAPSLHDTFFRTAVQDVVDGTPPEHLEQTLERRIDVVQRQHELEVARMRLILDGVVWLAEGTNPRQMYEDLAGQLLPQERQRLPELGALRPPGEHRPVPPGPLVTWRGERPRPIASFEDIGRMRASSMPDVVNAIRLEGLAVALQGVSKSLSDWFRAGMSTRNWARVQAIMDARADRSPQQIADEQESIVRIVRNLATIEANWCSP